MKQTNFIMEMLVKSASRRTLLNRQRMISKAIQLESANANCTYLPQTHTLMHNKHILRDCIPALTLLNFSFRKSWFNYCDFSRADEVR